LHSKSTASVNVTTLHMHQSVWFCFICELILWYYAMYWN